MDLSENSVLAVMKDCKPTRNPQEKIALVVNASFIASGFTPCQYSSSDGETWVHAREWNHHENNNYAFLYITPAKSTEKIEVKVIEKGGGVMMVNALRLDGSSGSRSNTNIKWNLYVAEDQDGKDPDFGGLVEKIWKKIVRRYDDRPRDHKGKLFTQIGAKLYLGPKASTHGNAIDEEGPTVHFLSNTTLKKFAEELEEEYKPEGFRLIIDESYSPYVKFESEALKSESIVSPQNSLKLFAKEVFGYGHGHDEGYQLILDNTGNFCAKLDFESPFYRQQVAKAKEKRKGPTCPRHSKVARRSVSPIAKVNPFLRWAKPFFGLLSKKGKRKLSFVPKASTHGDGAERDDTDEEGRSICVRNLALDSNFGQVLEELKKFGPIKSDEFKVVMNNTGNYSACVEYESGTSKQRAIEVACSSVRTKLYFGPKASTHGDGTERIDTDEEGCSTCERRFRADITLRQFVEELNKYEPEGFRLVIDNIGNLSAYVKFESEAQKRESYFSSDITLGRFVKKVRNYGPNEYRLMIDNTGNFCACLDFGSASYKKHVAEWKYRTKSEYNYSDDSMSAVVDTDSDEGESFSESDYEESFEESDYEQLSEEETPAKVEAGKKRSSDSEPKTSAANKKVRDGKNAGTSHVATHPSKQTKKKRRKHGKVC